MGNTQSSVRSNTSLNLRQFQSVHSKGSIQNVTSIQNLKRQSSRFTLSTSKKPKDKKYTCMFKNNHESKSPSRIDLTESGFISNHKTNYMANSFISPVK